MHGLQALHHLTVASAHPIFTLGSGTQLTKLNNWRAVYGSLHDLLGNLAQVCSLVIELSLHMAEPLYEKWLRKKWLCLD